MDNAENTALAAHLNLPAFPFIGIAGIDRTVYTFTEARLVAGGALFYVGRRWIDKGAGRFVKAAREVSPELIEIDPSDPRVRRAQSAQAG